MSWGAGEERGGMLVNTMVSPDAMSDLQIRPSDLDTMLSRRRAAAAAGPGVGFRTHTLGQVICPIVLGDLGKNDSRTLTPHSSPLKHGLLPHHKMALC